MDFLFGSKPAPSAPSNNYGPYLKPCQEPTQYFKKKKKRFYIHKSQPQKHKSQTQSYIETQISFFFYWLFFVNTYFSLIKKKNTNHNPKHKIETQISLFFWLFFVNTIFLLKKTQITNRKHNPVLQSSHLSQI